MEYPVLPATPYWDRTIYLSFLMPVTLALQLGTGGQPTSEYNRLRYDLSGAVAGYYRPANVAYDAVLPETATNNISRILDILKLPVSGFAKYMGVSRTAIYDWMSGKQINAVNAAKLDNFTKAADIIDAADVQMSPIVRNRKMPDGMTLFESIASGVDGEKATLVFVNMLRGEAERRNQLTARFAGRKAVSKSIDDAPVIFNE